MQRESARLTLTVQQETTNAATNAATTHTAVAGGAAATLQQQQRLNDCTHVRYEGGKVCITTVVTTVVPFCFEGPVANIRAHV